MGDKSPRNNAKAKKQKKVKKAAVSTTRAAGADTKRDNAPR